VEIQKQWIPRKVFFFVLIRKPQIRSGKNMEVRPTILRDLLIIEPTIHEDNRGFFFESYNQKEYEKHGIRENFIQDNHSKSVQNTLRGLHYQVNPGQAKLVRVIQGHIFDVAVDIRFGSPTFGQWAGIFLSAEDKKQLYIPVGFAHGFYVLSDFAEFEYKCSAFYSPQDERGILWNDPDLDIDWPATNPILSDKDKSNPPFREIEKDFIYEPSTYK
jgi:dTDP-4-dehydrorhamnose 3,5-epimerase